MNRWIFKLPGLALLAAILLSGCGTTYLLDNNVQSFSGLAALPSAPTYRFDRLPSQQFPSHDQLEAIADPALHKAGLRRDDASPRYTVQVAARMQRVLSPWASPWDGWGWGGLHQRRFWHSPFGRMESPWYEREVTVIIRELPSSKVVFESHAANDGPWLDNTSVFLAMFEAALAGFPNPPAGPRQVNIQVGR